MMNYLLAAGGSPAVGAAAVPPSAARALGMSTVRESGFCWTIWIRFFYGCSGCAVYFVFSTFLLFQIL